MTLQEVKEKIAAAYGFDNWSQLIHNGGPIVQVNAMDEVAENYAHEKMLNALSRAEKVAAAEKKISVNTINDLIKFLQTPDNPALISDGYHTFNELYEHRNRLFISLCSMAQSRVMVWRSTLRSDGKREPGYFLLGINETPGFQITYHLPIYYWIYTEFKYIRTLKVAPPFDGHNSDEVLARLQDFYINA